MQGNEEKESEDGKEGGRKGEKGNGAAAAADADDDVDEVKEDEYATTMIIVPTKTEDGGSRNEQTTSTSTRPDAFQTYADNDTRMLTLLGLHPAPNPNEGEREDWRQLTGFTGIGEDRRRRNDEDGGTTQRRTRLSFELHGNAFENMWIQGAGLNLLDGGAQQQQQQQEGEDNNNEAEQQQHQQGG
jgi:hypothetical protein